MERAEARQIALSTLKVYFDKLGYTLISIPNLTDDFEKKTDFGLIKVGFYFKDNGYHVFNKVSISFLEVECIIIDIKNPHNDFSSQIENGDYHLSTVYDYQTILPYDEPLTKKSVKVKNAIDLELMVARIIDYMDGKGLQFIEKYNSLSTVLAEMNRLEKEGRYWNEEILLGGSDSFFRGLIISKLCNDIEFDKKVQMVDKLFYEDLNDPWIPYYERLKERMKTIEPKYNL